MSNIQIRSAFIEDNKGFVLKIAEPHSRKNDQGNYETVSRTFFDVKVSRDSGINLDQFVKGDRITVEGRLVTDVREWEGKKLYTLTVWADSVALAEGQGRVGSSNAPSADPWATPTETGAQNASYDPTPF